MRKFFVAIFLLITAASQSMAQVDTTFIYNNSMPYGSLDLRIAKSASNYYYLQEDKTFSFRQSGGVATDTYFDMTSWDSSPYKQGNLREASSGGDQFVMNYRILSPDNYSATYSPGYPLLVILHGLGERGNCWNNDCYHADESWSPLTNSPAAPTSADSELLNNDHQLTNSGSYHLKAHKDAAGKLPDDPSLKTTAWPGFILQPQNLNGWSVNSAQDVIRIVRLLSKKYNIDENRIYIHGLSNGGQGVFETIKRAPWMFAAALTMSPIGDGFIVTQGMTPAVSHIPMWVFQGGLDKNPYPQKTESMIRKFKEAGTVVRYTLYPELGHGTWSSAYREPDFFPWILGINKADLHAFSGNATICGSGIELALAEGYFAYQWQKDGQTISGATSAKYTATQAGKYRARFSRVANPAEAQWNPWSDEIQVNAGQALPQAEIIQRGTVLLRDLNNGNNALLEAKGKFDRYQWFKNGVLVDFEGDQDDTLKNVTITSAMGAGAYTLVVANYDNCSSTASASKNIIFNNSAPTTVTAPGSFAGSVTSGIEANLSWTDASANEIGFEIWRRKKLPGGTFDPWEMATITAANTTSYKDSGLQPTTDYEYRVRAVSADARSNYAPSNTTSITVTTTTDTQPPTAPTEITGAATGVSKVKISWSPSTDNGKVKDYVITFGETTVTTTNADTTIVITDLPVNEVLKFTVKARDESGNTSSESESVEISTYVSGLFYEHSTGSFTDLDAIDWSHAEFTGKVSTFTLAPRTQEEYFNFKFDGFLFLEEGGAYQFRTSSDDGSRLTLNNEMLVDNDGIHTMKTVTSADKTLEAGAQRITVWFFESTESDSLLVEYKGADTNGEWKQVGAEALKSSETVVTGIEDDNGPEDSFKVSVYPNPASQNNIHVAVQTAIEEPVAIQLLDPIGKQLLNEQHDLIMGQNEFQLSPSGTLTPGIYFVIVKQRKTSSRQRLIIK